MLTDIERKQLSELPAADHNKAIQGEVDKIHRFVNTGSTNRDGVNDALERIHLIVQGNTSKPVKAAPMFGLKPYAATKPSRPLTASPPIAPH